MSATACLRCGATCENERVCKYCGSLFHGLSDPEEERRALLELQRILSDADVQKRKELVKTAFLPDHVPLLIEAGLMTLPLIDFGNGAPAVSRLEAIALKLRLNATDPKALEAAKEFEQRIATFRRNDRVFLVGCIAFALGLVAAITWIVLKFFGEV